ncbi:biotin transporter BioY [Kineococcus sp. SYSU DK005]|uniref:biotin transporter BioY n=1 Tax=Kineococcus sp. SYSU DK005 TaxID=3383126 RepID=UPI003D7EB0CD
MVPPAPRPAAPAPERARSTGVRRPVNPAAGTAMVAVFAALLCALAVAGAVPVGVLAVPITLQTLGVMLCGAVLGPWRGAAAALVYLVLGFAGLPVFAQGGSGLGVLAGASAGFLLSYPVAALVTGAVVRPAARAGRRFEVPGLVVGCLVGGIVVVYAGGVAGMVVNGGLDVATAVKTCLAYVPGDLVKVVLTVVVAAPVLRAFPRLHARG